MLDIQLSHGNKKLVSTKDVQFLIFNLPAIATCPFSTAECRKSCYAMKAERLYPTARERRLKHLQASQDASFVGDMIKLINKEYMKAKKAGKQIYFRWHESGDIYSLDYMFKIIQIAKAFDDTDIVFQCYTKSVQYIPEKGIPHNLHITYSIWNDTDQCDIERAKALGLQTFSAMPNTIDIPENNICHCVSCAECGKCYNNTVRNIYVKIH